MKGPKVLLWGRPTPNMSIGIIWFFWKLFDKEGRGEWNWPTPPPPISLCRYLGYMKTLKVTPFLCNRGLKGSKGQWLRNLQTCLTRRLRICCEGWQLHWLEYFRRKKSNEAWTSLKKWIGETNQSNKMEGGSSVRKAWVELFECLCVIIGMKGRRRRAFTIPTSAYLLSRIPFFFFRKLGYPHILRHKYLPDLRD